MQPNLNDEKMSRYGVVMLGGALGAVCRFIAGTAVAKLYSGTFPLGTFLINITGSFLIGLLMSLFLNRPSLDAHWRLFLVTGILGGYTTFSSFEWEALISLRSGAGSVALLYLSSSTLVGLVCAWIGLLIANKVWFH
jgi:CrcB protein